MTIEPVTAETWQDFVQFFEARGSPHHCWCALYRVAGAKRTLLPADRKSYMGARVAQNCPVGLLAYQDGKPVGWCSVAPRETYATLARSRTMPRVTPATVCTWTVLCFFISRPQRNRGLTRELLNGAARYAHAHGAAVLEGYPFDSAGISATHRGHSKAFRGAGFKADGKRWVLDLTDQSGPPRN